ncbi:MAG TPA: permease [Micromonosporaceae bacterium]|nr:permease [Micromonosporaceae bacterium]
MNTVVATVTEVLGRVLLDVWTTLTHVWPFLLLSIVAAAALSTYVGTERLAAALRRRTAVAVFGAVALAALTPFCSCGTTAVVLGALASRVPWAPLVAFMVSSPLTSPEEYALSIGLFGRGFATTFFFAAIVLGLLAGAATALIERTGWLAGQARMRAEPPDAPCSGHDERSTAVACQTSPTHPAPVAYGAATATLTRVTLARAPAPLRARWKLDAFARDLVVTARRLALYFLGFATVGYLLIETVPTAWLTDYLGGGSVWATPLAALLGIPVYLNTEGSMPLVAALMNGGMGSGPALAFLLTGSGTSIGAITGMLLIARSRVVALVVGLLFAGAVVLGWLAPLWL